QASCHYTRLFCTILYSSCGIPDASLKKIFALDSLKTLALPNVIPAETVSNMSRRKQGKPQHLSKREFSPEPVTADIPEDGESHPRSEPSTPKGDQDLLTCGQCRSRFPLADILEFIEHKRRQCQGRLCMDKCSDLPPSPPPAGLRRACVPVEVAVQVSPHGEEHLASTPHGLRPKQENLTGRVTDVCVEANL
ncbi:hypothetical protein PO909_006204, partial [Leuciscus waleckii]